MEPRPPLAGAAVADVVIVGGGYLGLWTAWQLKQLEPEIDVVLLEAHTCGHGPSGRNGGFVSTLWDDLPILRDRVGDLRAVEVCRASERAVAAVGTWCAENSVDAWYRAAGTIQVATSEAQLGDWDELVEACRAVGAPEEAVPLSADEVAARCASTAFLGGAFLRVAANVQPARLALGLRAKVIESGVRLHEHSAVRRLTARRSCRDRRRHGEGEGCSACSQHRHRRLRRLPPVPRGGVEPHGHHRASPRRDRGDRLGRRGERARLPDAAALLPHDRGRAHRPRLGRWPHGGRRPPPGTPRRRPRRHGAGGLSAAPVLPATPGTATDARLGRADRRLSHSPADLRQPRAHPPRVRVHRERGRTVVPRRRDPGTAGARPP